ncbi:hypothetical protein ABPG73_016094 [Tetrahymena malaccensis]
MACCLQNEDDGKSIISEINEQIEEMQLKKTLSQIIQEAQSNNKYNLMRGGCVIKSVIGPIQFGIPPETVKDSLNLGQEVPTFYIIPSKRFDKKNGVNVAEFEFPAYFNFFVKKRKCTLICTQEAERAVRTVFQETLLGPVSFEHIEEDYYYSYPKDGIPDFNKELKVFAKNPMNPSEALKVDTLISFVIFDESGVARLNDSNGNIVEIKKENGNYSIIENGKLLDNIKDEVNLPEGNLFESFGTISTDNISHIKDSGQQIGNQFNHDRVTFESPTKSHTKNLIAVWTSKLGQMKCIQDIQNFHPEFIDESETITPPDFGVTVLGSSHGFDPKGSTTGFIIWIYGKGIMVDPPPFSSQFLKKMGIPSVLIHGIIITHCHADHDAGTFTKLLDDSRVEVITTRTIMNSFLRKYSALSGMGIEELKHLFIFRPVTLGTSINIYGANFRFFYAFHTIPCIGFECELKQRSIYYSADTFYNPEQLKEFKRQGIFGQKRYEQLANVKFNNDIIIHEAGVPPIHTPQTVLASLPIHIKNKMMLIHIAEKDLLKDSGLKIAKHGIENTLILHPSGFHKNMDTLRRLDLLSSIDIFENLTIKNIKWLLDSLVEEQYYPKQIVVKENTIGNKFYIIESGIARVYSNNKNNQFERFYQTGEYFGETALICHGGKRIANVEAVTELRLLTLEKHDFKFIFGDGCGGDGPVIRKFMNLTDARKSKALHVLYKNSVFNEMGQSQKTQLEMILKEEEVDKGQVMWNVGDKASFAFIIKKGNFEFVDCPESELDELESGAFIGEVKSITDNSPLTTSVVATRKGKIFKIYKEDLISFLNKNPGLQLVFQDCKYIE